MKGQLLAGLHGAGCSHVLCRERKQTPQNNAAATTSASSVAGKILGLNSSSLVKDGRVVLDAFVCNGKERLTARRKPSTRHHSGRRGSS